MEKTDGVSCYDTRLHEPLNSCLNSARKKFSQITEFQFDKSRITIRLNRTNDLRVMRADYAKVVDFVAPFLFLCKKNGVGMRK